MRSESQALQVEHVRVVGCLFRDGVDVEAAGDGLGVGLVSEVHDVEPGDQHLGALVAQYDVRAGGHRVPGLGVDLPDDEYARQGAGLDGVGVYDRVATLDFAHGALTASHDGGVLAAAGCLRSL